jgi:hypothetical protein
LEGKLFDQKGKTRVVQSAINGQFSKIKQINAVIQNDNISLISLG